MSLNALLLRFPHMFFVIVVVVFFFFFSFSSEILWTAHGIREVVICFVSNNFIWFFFHYSLCECFFLLQLVAFVVFESTKKSSWYSSDLYAIIYYILCCSGKRFQKTIYYFVCVCKRFFPTLFVPFVLASVQSIQCQWNCTLVCVCVCLEILWKMLSFWWHVQRKKMKMYNEIELNEGKKANDCAEYNVMAFCGKFLRIKDIDKYI